MDATELEITHNAEAGRFEAELQCGQAYVLYRPEGGALDLLSTWVPSQHRGLGIGERLVVHVLQHARDVGCRVIPTCPFIPRVIERNPEFAGLVADSSASES